MEEPGVCHSPPVLWQLDNSKKFLFFFSRHGNSCPDALIERNETLRVTCATSIPFSLPIWEAFKWLNLSVTWDIYVSDSDVSDARASFHWNSSIHRSCRSHGICKSNDKKHARRTMLRTMSTTIVAGDLDNNSNFLIPLLTITKNCHSMGNRKRCVTWTIHRKHHRHHIRTTFDSPLFTLRRQSLL